MMQFFKITIHPYTQPDVFSLGLRSMKMHFNIFPGQHNAKCQIIEPLWSVLESRIRSRFLLPTPLKQLEDVPHEEW
jgi:hypothetical protein